MSLHLCRNLRVFWPQLAEEIRPEPSARGGGRRWGAAAQGGAPSRMNHRPSRSRPSSSKASTAMKLNHSACNPHPGSCGTARTDRCSRSGSRRNSTAPSSRTSVIVPATTSVSSPPGIPRIQTRTERPSGEKPRALPTRSSRRSRTRARVPAEGGRATRRGPRRLCRLGALVPAVVLFGRRLGDQGGLQALLDRLLGHHALLHVAPRRQLELYVEQRLLEDRAKPARAGLSVERAVGDRLQRVVGEDQ